MLIPQQVIDCLYRIEGAQRYFNEYGIPVAHRSIPKSWQFESLQILSVLTLPTDKTSTWVDILWQIKLLSLIVLRSAYQIYRIEMSSIGKHLYVLLVVLIDLTRLKNLQTYRTILVISKERTAARLTYILDDTANSHWTIQLLLQIDNKFSIFQFLDISTTAAEFSLQESYYLD